MRHLLQFQGTVEGSGYPALDVSEAELVVANMANLSFWPGLFSWDLAAGATSFQDRITDAPVNTEGGAALAAKFTAAPGGGSHYKVAAAGDRIRSVLNTAGSFSVGICCVLDSGSADVGFGFGSHTSAAEGGAPAPWWVATTGLNGGGYNLGGRIGSIAIPGWNTGGVTADVEHRIIFTFNRATGTATVYFDGVQVTQLVSVPAGAVVTLDELQIGGVRVGTGSNQVKAGWYKGAVAFTRALSVAEVGQLDAMLAAL
jgi:hypothetical protein